MERLAEVDTVIFDKTGTLTHGSPAVLDVISYRERHHRPAICLGLAAAAETRLKHPVAEALRVKARELGANIPLLRRDHISHRPRRRRPGQRLLSACRQRALHAPERHQCPRRATADRAALDEQGYSCLYVAVDGDARRAGAVYRPNPARKPRRHPAAASRMGITQHRHADRRQCGGRAGGRPAARPVAPIRRHAAGRQGRGDPGSCSARATSSPWSATASTICRR